MRSDTEPRFKVITGGRQPGEQEEHAGAALPPFEEALAKHLDRLFGFALRLEKGNDAKAEDLVQETSLKAFRAYGSVRNAEALKSWFYRVLFNVFLDQQERRKREPPAQNVEWSESLLEEPPGSDKDSPDFKLREDSRLRKLQWAFGTACLVLFGLFIYNLQKPSLEWQQFSSEKLAQAQRQGSPVILDFYADWCIPCLELDRLTFTDPQVIEATRDFVKLKVDLTLFDSGPSEALRQEFNVSGVPTIVFLRSDGEERRESRVVGFVGPEEFIQRVRPVLEPIHSEVTVEQGVSGG